MTLRGDFTTGFRYKVAINGRGSDRNLSISGIPQLIDYEKLRDSGAGQAVSVKVSAEKRLSVFFLPRCDIYTKLSGGEKKYSPTMFTPLEA